VQAELSSAVRIENGVKYRDAESQQGPIDRYGSGHRGSYLGLVVEAYPALTGVAGAIVPTLRKPRRVGQPALVHYRTIGGPAPHPPQKVR
jgi:hypothetical protein